MKNTIISFLKAMTVLFGAAILAAMIYLPQTEGRNIHRDVISVYTQDPFLWYVCVMSIPFFIALYQVVKLLGNIERNKTFSKASATALQNIKYCTLASIGGVAGAATFIRFTGEEDAAGFLALCGFAMLVGFVVSGVAAWGEKYVRSRNA